MYKTDEYSAEKAVRLNVSCSTKPDRPTPWLSITFRWFKRLLLILNQELPLLLKMPCHVFQGSSLHKS